MALDRSADYGVLNGLARNRMDRELIARNWDDLLRLAGSLKMSTVGEVELLRSLQGGGRVSTLGRALTELGRGPKMLHLLTFFDDEDHRRYIGRYLTRHESRHKLARAVYHGRKGQLRQPYREGTEDQCGALSLVVNVMLLWTTLYMDRALSQLQDLGATINDEDVARLSPLGTNHTNVLGRYHFALPDAIARGECRSLRDPTDFEDEDHPPPRASDGHFRSIDCWRPFSTAADVTIDAAGPDRQLKQLPILNFTGISGTQTRYTRVRTKKGAVRVDAPRLGGLPQA